MDGNPVDEYPGVEPLAKKPPVVIGEAHHDRLDVSARHAPAELVHRHDCSLIAGSGVTLPARRASGGLLLMVRSAALGLIDIFGGFDAKKA
jgi:hypothetical protein